jgi:predicted HD phosphohydrolase
MTTDELEEVLMSLGGVFDGEEQVDELSHALQCAHLAQMARTSDELIAAALFHDVARSPVVARDYPNVAHEIAGAAWLLPRFGERVAQLVRAHVAAKLHLLATQPGYKDILSRESVKSAAHQGPPPPAELLVQPWWEDALRLRRFDDAAKDPNALLPDPQELLMIVRALKVS